MKNIKEHSQFILRAVALALAIATFVTGMLGVSEPGNQLNLLSMSVIALAMALLQTAE